ncbi:MAG: BON domain-containing protein [Pseudomonadota bacterium]
MDASPTLLFHALTESPTMTILPPQTFALLGVILTTTLTGCAAAVVGTAGAVGVASVQERSVGAAIDDAGTSNEIKSRLLSERGYGEVDVEVEGGQVLLTGRVNTPEERVRAEDVAWSVSSTVSVANEINIEPPGGFISNVSDEFTTARVRAALLAASDVRSVNINIETYDGVVYLMGLVRSQSELEEAAEKASFVRGVKQVVSFMRVREARTRQPAPVSVGQASSQSTATPPSEYLTDVDELLGGTGS